MAEASKQQGSKVSPSPATPTASSSKNIVPPALQHSPSPPPMKRTSSYTQQQATTHTHQQQQQQQTAAIQQRQTRASSTKTSPPRKAPSTTSLQYGQSRGPTISGSIDLTRKEEVKKLAQRLATRLQFAAFKVEKGWTKHSLTEVENLYWKALTGATSTRSTGQAGSSSSLLPNLSYLSSSRPAVSRGPSQSSVKRTKRSSDPITKSDEVTVDEEEADVFGSTVQQRSTLPTSSSTGSVHSVIVNGLPTPPPSGGDQLSTPGIGKMNPANLRASPTRQIQATQTQQQQQGTGNARNSSVSTNAVGSGYADFWNKLGSTTTTTAATKSTVAKPKMTNTTRSSSVVAGQKRAREGEDDTSR